MRIMWVKAAYVFVLCMILLSGCGKENERQIIHLAIPYSDRVQDYDSNYYINWLEEKTDTEIDITVIKNKRSEEYLSKLLDSELDIDAVFFGDDFTIGEDDVQKIFPSYVNASEYCYASNSGLSMSSECGQVLWINKQWLLKLGLSVPGTVRELEKVFKEFCTRDPNGNGKNDEIPLAGSMATYGSNPLYFLLNSYVYTDPYHSFTNIDEAQKIFSPVTDEFREGLIYMNQLYREKAIDDYAFSCTKEQFLELVNSPDDLVGAFVSESVSDVIYPDNPEIMARFIHVHPVASSKCEGYAMYRKYHPSVGAVVNYKTKRYEAVTRLLDTMMTEEASLIARYGEKDVDWEYAKDWDVGIYGAKATITTKNYIWNTSQNKHLSGIGPMMVPEKYLSGITWNGVNSDMEYIDARAKMSYENYFPKEVSETIENKELVISVNENIISFLKGEADVLDEKIWKDYISSMYMYAVN